MSNIYTCLAGSAGNHPPHKFSAVLHHLHSNITMLRFTKIVCCRYRR